MIPQKTFLQAKYDRELDIEVQKEEAFEYGVQQGVSRIINESVPRYIRKQRFKGMQDEQILTDIVDIFDLSETEAKELLNDTSPNNMS